jgi:hypothetical protein
LSTPEAENMGLQQLLKEFQPTGSKRHRLGWSLTVLVVLALATGVLILAMLDFL